MTRIKIQCNKSLNDLCKNIKLVSCCIGIAFIFSACNSVDTSINSEKNIGYFISNFNESVDYLCENKRQRMNDSGKFECSSFPIAFYMDEMKIGEISSIHKDGYVYPQDIIMLEAKAAVYTSESSIRYLTIE
ncbi:MAG TPA: hypothetical protein EYG94_00445 [Campylobacterales bacterium]|nr:hypothetical protein [Campylobacterales bacterium]